MTVFVIAFLILFIPVLVVRTSPEEAAAVVTGIGMVVWGFYAPVAFGITIGMVFLIILIWLGVDSARQLWRRE